MIPFNYHHLYYFYVTAKERSISKAAQLLRISQPALSAQIKLLENYWGIRLFDRNNRKIALSEEGDFLLQYAKAIFDMGQELSDRLIDHKYLQPVRISIGIPSAVPQAIAEALITFVYKIAPEVHLICRQDRMETLIHDLMIHRLDLIINDCACQTSFEESIENYLIATIPMVFCVKKSLAGKYKNIPKDLNEAPLILPTISDQTYHAMQNYIHANKIKPNIIAEVQNLNLVGELVSLGKGIGVLNRYAVLRSPLIKGITILENRSKSKISDTIYLIKRKRKIAHPLVDEIISNFKLL